MKYSVGDRVKIKSLDWYNENKSKSHGTVACGGKYFDYDMREWCGKTMTILTAYQTCYIMREDGAKDLWTDEMIEGLVEEEDKYWCDIMSESGPTTYVLPQGYQFKDENGNIINATKIVLEKKNKEYPKTSAGCCETLYRNSRHDDCYEACLQGHPMQTFARLLICRDAYWKIAGEEMGLDGPWEPDYETEDNNRIYVLTTDSNVVVKSSCYHCNYILAFPTEEMRDAFYENFKELINECKKLL